MHLHYFCVKQGAHWLFAAEKLTMSWRLMEKALSCLLLLLPLLLVVRQALHNVIGAPAYLCSDAPLPCQTFVFYRAQAPRYLCLDSIGDLFRVSRLMIAQASNLETEDTMLVGGQLSLVPVTCGCTGNVSQANITYQINGGDDTYYLVATTIFENLTTYQAAEAANPDLDPSNLPNGTEVVFPVRCRCPSKAQMERGINILLTYVMQKDDTLFNISEEFNASLRELISENGGMASANFGGSTILIPVSEKPVLSRPNNLFALSPFRSYTVLPNSSTFKRNNHSTGISIGVLIPGAVGFLAVGLVFALLWKRRRSSKLAKVCEDEEQPPCPKFRVMNKTSVIAQEELLAGVSHCLDTLSMYSIEDLREATQNFSPLFKIGGSVYRGTINGREFAIKQMKTYVPEELKILGRLNHGNLVRMEGLCTSCKGPSYLIYEYAENGSLDLWLRNKPRAPRSFLTWRTRLQIALDVAFGLQYIHEHTTPGVVHKDVKSSNILLDSKLRAKIANFAMTKCGINALAKHIQGTQGYMAPEYLSHGLVSTKLDVFAFGVVLLELISGKEAVHINAGDRRVWTQIRPLLEGTAREEKLRKWMDPNLKSLYPIDSALSLAIMAMACVSEHAADRPTMEEIVYRLSKMLEVCFDHEMCDSWEMD